MTHLSLAIEITFDTAFHTTGDWVRMGVDKTTARSADGQLIVPATTVKGLVRAAAGAVFHTWGVPACDDPTLAGSCLKAGGPCLICRVFGNAQTPAQVRFYAAGPRRSSPAPTRSGVSISRQRRAALEQRLFVIETTNQDAGPWVSKAEGFFPDETAAHQAAALILLAARFSPILGGARSRGLGWIKKWEISPSLDGQTIPESELTALWPAWENGGAQ